MSNGSLQDRLYGTSHLNINFKFLFGLLLIFTYIDLLSIISITGEAAKRKTLDWPTRLSIALGAARGK